MRTRRTKPGRLRRKKRFEGREGGPTARSRTFAGKRAARPGGTGAARSFRPALTGAAAHGCRAGSRVSGQALLSLCRSRRSRCGGRAAPPRSGAAGVPRAIFTTLPAGLPPRGGCEVVGAVAADRRCACPRGGRGPAGASASLAVRTLQFRTERNPAGRSARRRAGVGRGGGSGPSLSTCRAETGPQGAWRFASRGAGQFPF